VYAVAHKLQFKCQPSPAADSGPNSAVIGSSWTFHWPPLGDPMRECSLLAHNDLAGSSLEAVFMSLPGSAKSKRGMQRYFAPMSRCAVSIGVSLDFSRSGKPTDNALIESFKGREAFRFVRTDYKYEYEFPDRVCMVKYERMNAAVP
jgi:hypothetical protein